MSRSAVHHKAVTPKDLFEWPRSGPLLVLGMTLPALMAEFSEAAIRLRLELDLNGMRSYWATQMILPAGWFAIGVFFGRAGYPGFLLTSAGCCLSAFILLTFRGAEPQPGTFGDLWFEPSVWLTPLALYAATGLAVGGLLRKWWPLKDS